MNYVDYIIIAAIAVGFILGFKDGLVRKIIGVLGLIAAVLLAFSYSNEVGEFLAPVFDDEQNLAEIVGGILIFLTVILISSIIKRIIHPVDKVNKFINQILGGLTGTIQMVFFISGFLLFLNIFKVPNESVRSSSLLYTKMYSVVPTTIDLIVGDKSKATDFINTIIEKKDSIDLNEIEIDSTIIN